MTLQHTLLAGLVAGLGTMTLSAGAAPAPQTGCAGGQHAMPGPAHADGAAMAQQRLARLKSDLKLTPAQDSAWQAYATQMSQQLAARQAARQARTPPTGTAPERMGQHIEMMKQRLADMSAGQAALQDLYSVLSTEQRAVVDQHAERMAGPGREGHGPGR
jgi:periplasmic protein CpxP/Spy